MTINNKYKYGETVYFVNDPHQSEYIVSGFSIRPNRFVYYVSNCGTEVTADEFELSNEIRIW